MVTPSNHREDAKKTNSERKRSAKVRISKRPSQTLKPVDPERSVSSKESSETSQSSDTMEEGSLEASQVVESMEEGEFEESQGLESFQSTKPASLETPPMSESAEVSGTATEVKITEPGEELFILLDSAVYAAEKVRKFPHHPGVYLMKDGAGRVLYVGKAKDLHSRAGSYFTKAAAEDPRTCRLIPEIRDIDYLETESEVDAFLLESRLIKDIQPPHNRAQKDDKTFPYLELVTSEPFPRVRITRQLEKNSGRTSKVFGPFTCGGSLRGAVQVLQKIFRFRTCAFDITENDAQWDHFRPCLLYSIQQCSAPCNRRISHDDYRRDIRRLIRFLEGGRRDLLRDMKREMTEAATSLQFEEAAKLRDEIHLLETLDERGELETDVQPEVFAIDPKEGVESLRKVLGMDRLPRVIEGVDIAHLAGDQTVASLVQFLDGLPFKPHYRHYRIQGVDGINDPASIYEVVSRRFRGLIRRDDPFADLMLIDGGRAQLNAALAAVRNLGITPLPQIVSLAKREEEIYTPYQDEPIRLPRNRFALRLLQYVRDEAHRFAQHYHHILRRKSQLGEDE